MINKFRVFEYDVWGNDEDGYTVNDVWGTNTFLDLEDNIDDEGLIKALVEAGQLKPEASKYNVRVDGEPDYTFYFTQRENEYPLLELKNLKNYPYTL